MDDQVVGIKIATSDLILIEEALVECRERAYFNSLKIINKGEVPMIKVYCNVNGTQLSNTDITMISIDLKNENVPRYIRTIIENTDTKKRILVGISVGGSPSTYITFDWKEKILKSVLVPPNLVKGFDNCGTEEYHKHYQRDAQNRTDSRINDSTIEEPKRKKKKRHCYIKECSNRVHLICTRCERVYFCSEECQRIAWKFGHREECYQLGDSKKE